MTLKRDSAIIIALLLISTPLYAAVKEPAEEARGIDPNTPDTAIVATEPAAAIAIFHDALAREDYAAARAVIDSLKAGDSPAMKPWMRLLRATLTGTLAIDYGIEEHENLFHSDIKAATESFSLDLELHELEMETPRRASLRAALGSLALLDAQWENEMDGDVLTALGPAGDGYEHMKQAYALDSRRMDALLGIAAYRFFKSNALKFLAWTPFVKDERPDAIDGLRTVINTPGPAQAGAVTTLAWALIEMNRPGEAADLCRPWLDRLGYPRHLLEPYAKALYLSGDWPEARNACDLYLDALRGSPELNEGRLLGALNRAVQILEQQQDWAAVAAYADEGLKQPLNQDEWSKYKPFRNAFEQARRLASGKLAQSTGS